MRKYLALIVDDPRNPERNGLVESRDEPFNTRVEKNERRPVQKRDLETDETWQVEMVGMGYADFENQEDYEERWKEVAIEKMAELDDEHLEAAGVLDVVEEHRNDEEVET